MFKMNNFTIIDYSNVGLVLEDLDRLDEADDYHSKALAIAEKVSNESIRMGVFISYARQDSDAAQRLYNDLSSKTDLNPWLDKENLLPGQNWNLEIRKAIKNSGYFIALFSSESVKKRGYVQKEFKKAIDTLDEFPEGEIFAIPVRLDECEIPSEKFRRIQRVDMFPVWDEGVRKLLLTLNTLK
jgi:tetratricopeptide (TPR) repeat protein